MANLKSITYNGVTYPSMKAFAKAFETPTLSWETIKKRLQNEYSLEEAIKDECKKNTKSITYNGVTYPSINAFAKTFETPTLSYKTIINRILRGYSLEKAIKDGCKRKNKKSITYNGTTYPSINAFAKTFETPTLHRDAIRYRILRGYSLEKAIKDKCLCSKPKSITYNNTTYPSIKAFAKAFETPTLSWETIKQRLKKGYTFEKAIKDEYIHSYKKSITYNGITYPSIRAFAKAFNTPTLSYKTIINRMLKGYSLEESILPYIKFNKNLQIDNHLKIINQTNNKSNYNVLINNKPEIWSIIMINKYLEKNNITL